MRIIVVKKAKKSMAEPLYIINSKGIAYHPQLVAVYHQNEVLYRPLAGSLIRRYAPYINTECCIDACRLTNKKLRVVIIE